MTPRHVLMGVTLAGAAALVLLGDNTPDSGVAQPSERHAPKATVTTAAATAAASQPQAVAAPPAQQPAPQSESTARNGQGAAPADVAILRLIPREQLVGESGDAVFGGPEGVFGTRSWTPPPPPAPKPPPPPPPPPPMAPPLPYTYIGKAVSDGVWEVFLARGLERTLIVRNQMVLDGAYRVDAIAPPVMKLTYLPLNQVQQINIGVAE